MLAYFETRCEKKAMTKFNEGVLIKLQGEEDMNVS